MDGLRDVLCSRRVLASSPAVREAMLRQLVLDLRTKTAEGEKYKDEVPREYFGVPLECPSAAGLGPSFSRLHARAKHMPAPSTCPRQAHARAPVCAPQQPRRFCLP